MSSYPYHHFPTTGVGWEAGGDTTAADNANGWDGEDKSQKSPRNSPAVVGNNLAPGSWGVQTRFPSAGPAMPQEWGGQPTVSPAAGTGGALPNLSTLNGWGGQANISQLHRAGDMRGTAANDIAAHPLITQPNTGGFMAGGLIQAKAAPNGIQQQASSSKGGKKLKKTNSVHAPPPQQEPVPPPPPPKMREEQWRDDGDGYDDIYAEDYGDYDEEEGEEGEEEWEAPLPAPLPPTQSRAPPPAHAQALSPSATVAAYRNAAWSKWHDEARGLPKVTSSTNALPFVSPVVSAASGNRPVLSQQQRSRTLASLLSHPTQTKGPVTQSQGNPYQAVSAVQPAPAQPALRHTQQAQGFGHQTDAEALRRHLADLQQQQQQQMQRQMQQQQMQQQFQMQQQAQMQQGGGRGKNKGGHQQHQHGSQRPQKIQPEESWGTGGGWGGEWNDAIPEEDEGEESYGGDDLGDEGWGGGGGGGWTARQDDGGWAPVADDGGWGGGHEEQSRKHGGKKHRDREKKSRKDRDGRRSGSQAGIGWGGSQAGAGWGDNPEGGWDDNQTGGWGQEGGGWDTGQEGRGYQGGVSNKKATPSRTPRTLPPTHLPRFSGPTSKTMDMATGKMTTVFELTAPHNGMGENTFVDSHGLALQYAERALYSRSRPTKERIHWSFNPNKDPRVSSLLRWIDAMANGLVTIGVSILRLCVSIHLLSGPFLSYASLKGS